MSQQSTALNDDLQEQENKKNQDNHETIQFISFKIDQQEYAVDIMSVREIKGWVETTSLPNTPDFVFGVINLRGTIVPIIDLRARFHMGHTAPTKIHVVVIVAVERRVIGLLVDAVSDIITVSPEEIKPVPQVDTKGSGHELLSGLISLDNRVVSLLTLDHILRTVDLEEDLKLPEDKENEIKE